MDLTPAPGASGKHTAFANISRFMTDADIVLSAKEDQILTRWTFADTLFRSRRFREDDIIEQLVAKFSVSRHTARNDIYQAQALFERARKYSKKGLVWEHVQEIRLQIERAKNDKSLAAILPKLNDSLTNALKLLPEEIEKELPPAAPVHLHPAAGQVIEPGIDFAAARARAGEKLAERKDPEDYTDFEEVQP